MKKSIYNKEFKDYVISVVRLFKKNMYLHAWETLFIFDERHDEKGAAALIETTHEYLTFTITIFPALKNAWLSGDKEFVFKVLLHEVCHVFTDPLYKLSVDSMTNSNQKFIEAIREEWTQRMAVAFFDTYSEKTIKKPK